MTTCETTVELPRSRVCVRSGEDSNTSKVSKCISDLNDSDAVSHVKLSYRVVYRCVAGVLLFNAIVFFCVSSVRLPAYETSVSMHTPPYQSQEPRNLALTPTTILAAQSTPASGPEQDSTKVAAALPTSSPSVAKQPWLPKCSSSEIAVESSHLGTTLHTVSMRDLTGDADANMKMFEKLVRDHHAPVLLQSTSDNFTLVEFCKAIQPLAPRVPVREYKSSTKSGKGGQEWERTFYQLSWKEFCNVLQEFEACNSAVQSRMQSCQRILNTDPLKIPYSKIEAQHLLPLVRFAGPPYATRSGIEKGYQKPMLWIGAAGSQTPLHADSKDNIAMQLVGTKRWNLISPRYQDKCHYCLKQFTNCKFTEHWKEFHDSHNQSRCIRQGRGVQWSEFSMLAGSSAPTGVEILTVDVKPGDALYLPHYWGHKVENSDTSVMVNFWLMDSWSCCGGLIPETPKSLKDADGEINAEATRY